MESNWIEKYESPHHPVDLDMPSLSEILKLLDIREESVLNVYPYGSHLYGLAGPNSGMEAITT